MRKKRLALTGAATAGVIALTLFGTPGVAMASAGASVTGSAAYYDSPSNMLTSVDTKADGASAVAQLKYTSNGTTIIRTAMATHGNGTRVLLPISGARGTVYVRACLNNRSAGTGIYGCSGWKATVA